MSKGSILKAVRAINDGPSSPEPETAARLPARVAAGVIGATARTMSDIRQERDELLAKLAEGVPHEIDAGLIDPSPFPDRLPDANDPDFEALKKLIDEEGQKVAIQVRAHPKRAGRFQIIYGHRRWRAAKELGRPVRIEIVKANDEELAVSQGIENSTRQDLTWVERALFAWRLEQSGIKAKAIRSALSVDDAELARFRSVCRALTTEVIERIGRASKVGRPRWLRLAAAAATEESLNTIRETLAADKVWSQPSDERFQLALACLQAPRAEKGQGIELKGPAGNPVGRLAMWKNELKITFDKQYAEAFQAFMEAEMPELMNRFFASEGAEHR